MEDISQAKKLKNVRITQLLKYLSGYVEKNTQKNIYQKIDDLNHEIMDDIFIFFIILFYLFQVPYHK